MLREPFWLGLIAVFFVMILIGFAIISTIIIIIVIIIIIGLIAVFFVMILIGFAIIVFANDILYIRI